MKPLVLVAALVAARWVLPETGVGLLLRLALATALVLLPGRVLARALGLRGASATLALGLAALAGALAVVFLVHGTLDLAAVLLALFGLAAWSAGRRRLPKRAGPGWVPVAAGGVLLGLLLWGVAGEIGGDGLFHLARVRKLGAFDDLSLGSVNEFADGGLHPGYAFPLWHGFLALVASLAGVDPASVVLHEPSVLAPLALLVVYEAGRALFRTAAPAVAVVLAQVALTGLAPGHGGAYTALALPATATRQLLVPAALALALGAVAEPSRALLAAAGAAGLVVAAVHPTYALFLWLPFAGFVLVRALAARREALRAAAALAALAAPGLLFLAWLAPVVRDTVSHDPSGDEVRRALAHYAGQLDIRSETSYALAPEVFGRGGAVAIAALLLVPFAAFAWRRRWAAYVLGGSLAVFLVTLVPWLFTPFSDLVSLSQSRRVAGFLPFAFAFAGGLTVVAGRVRGLVLPLALAAGVVFQLAWPGDFDYRLDEGGPAVVTWIAAAGALVGLALAASGRLRTGREQGAAAAVAAALFVLPVAVHGFREWSPSAARPPSPLTAGLVEALRERVPPGAVVFSDLETSYRIAASAPVYVAAAPPGHVADTVENRPYVRRADTVAFFGSGDLAIPRRYGAGWLVLDRSRFDVRLRSGIEPVYADGRFSLYRL